LKIIDIAKVLNAEILVPGNDMENEVFSVCGSDLMSDVMAYVKDNVVLLTGLVSPQVIRTAEMMDIKVVVFVRGKKPPATVTKLAQEKDIIVMSTSETMFTACGKLYSSGVTGRGD